MGNRAGKSSVGKPLAVQPPCLSYSSIPVKKPQNRPTYLRKENIQVQVYNSESEAISFVVENMAAGRRVWHWISIWELTYLSASRRQRQLNVMACTLETSKPTSSTPPHQ